MKVGKSLIGGFLVFIVGFMTVFLSVGLWNQGSGGQISSSVFNAAMLGLIVAILFLSAVIVVCTLLIITAFKKK